MSTAEALRTDGAEDQLRRRRTFDRILRWDAGLPSDLVERIWQEPSALLADGDTLQDKRRCIVTRIDHSAGPFVWKHHNWGSYRRTFKRSLRQSVASKAWSDGHFLLSAGIPTPAPRAYLEQRLGPFHTCSYLLSDYVVGTSLYRLMRFDRPSKAFVEHLAEQVATIWQQLDDLRVWHNDFKTENLLVDPQGKVWLIDLERMRRFESVDRMRRRQVRDAGDLLHPRNWRSDPAAAELFRRAVLETPAAKQTLAGSGGAKHPLGRPVFPSNDPSQLVTVLIPCRNAAGTVAACVESVRDMADEILIALDGSDVETARVVRQLDGCRVIQHEDMTGAALEAWAAQQSRHPWILRVMADERLDSELGRQVQDIVATEPDEDGFSIPRTICFRGRRLQYGGFSRGSSIRLYRKDAAQYENVAGGVEVTIPSSKVGSLRAPLVYESCARIGERLSEMIRLAHQSARMAHQQGDRSRLSSVLWQAPRAWFQSYVLRGGWLDGWAGLHASCLWALEIYLHQAMLLDLEQPRAARRASAIDQSQGLKIFDPSDTIDSDAADGRSSALPPAKREAA